MKLSLGISPCPNDTFIFDALVNKKIDTGGIDFEVMLEDVQTLNEWALQSKLDISKISYGILPLLLNNHRLLDAGGALGQGVGPLLISKSPVEALATKIPEYKIAIPGENTTAHLLFSLAFPQATQKQFMVFSTIEEAVLSGKVDAGVIIHENRFTYQQKGLVKLVDLGQYWESTMNCPIPLGGIVMKKTFDTALCNQVNLLIVKSLQYAFERYPTLSDYVIQHAQEMEEPVMRQHINLYVNDFSLDLRKDGKKAVEQLLAVYANLHRTAPISLHENLAD